MNAEGRDTVVDHPEMAPDKKGIPYLKLSIWALVIAGLVIAAKYIGLQEHLKAALDWVEGQGNWAPIIFILLYIIACVFVIPGSVLTLGAGAIFGAFEGSLYVSVGATAGATVAFLIGRYFARDWVEKKIEGNETFVAIDRAVAEQGWRIVSLTRLTPALPFSIQNYAYGVTKVSLRDYFFPTWICIYPGTLMYTYLGSLAKAGIEPEGRTPAQWALYIVGLIATILVTVKITQIARKAFKREIT